MDPDHSISPEDPFKIPPKIDAAAAGWVARRNAGLDSKARDELRAWLAADARHTAAFARADRGATELDWPLHAGELERVLARLDDRARTRRGRRRVMTVAGTTVAAALALATLLPWSRERAAMPTGSPTLVVKMPEKRTLPDGTVVDLKDGANVAFDFSGDRRLVTLLKGTAHFKVTKNPRPFIVTAAGVSAHALGTTFSVEMDATNVSVLVTEGRVAVNRTPLPAASAVVAAPVNSAESLAVLDAGKGVRVALSPGAAAPAVVAPVLAEELDDRLSWRIPRLEFNGTPLAEVVAMVNRHNRVQFEIVDPSLEKLTLSGVLRADKVDALLALLESDFPVRAERRDQRILLHRSRAPRR